MKILTNEGPLRFGAGERGVAALEGMIVTIFVLVLFFGIVEFGSMIHAQATVTHIAREGGNLASRDFKMGDDLLDFLTTSSSSLDFSQNADRYKLYVMRVNAGDATDNDPTCDTVFQRGSLPGISSPQGDLNCSLTPELASYVTYNGTVAPVERFTVVTVYYHYTPLTPLGPLLVTPWFGGNDASMGDVVLSSKAIF